MRPIVLGIVVVLALIAAGAIFYAGPLLMASPEAALRQYYSNERFGLSFSYPTGYVLTETAGASSTDPYRIAIVRESDAQAVVENSEGPTAIFIEAYPLTASTSLEAFLTSETRSNLALGNGVLEPLTLNEVPGFSYTWSGLYEGVTAALKHRDYALLFSATFNSPTDSILEDFRTLLDSVRLN